MFSHTVNTIHGIIASGGRGEATPFSRQNLVLLLATSIINLPRSLPDLPLSYMRTGMSSCQTSLRKLPSHEVKDAMSVERW